LRCLKISALPTKQTVCSQLIFPVEAPNAGLKLARMKRLTRSFESQGMRFHSLLIHIDNAS